jgi:sodium transport system permease protein
MFENMANIWQKEIMDMVRDKKALRQTLIIPLVLGIVYALLNPMIGSLIHARAEAPMSLPVQGLEHAGADFIAIFEQFDIHLEPYQGDMEAAIGRGEEAAGLIFSPGFGELVAAEEPATLTVRTNASTGGPFGGNLSITRLQVALNAYNQSVTIGRLQAQGVDPAVLNPVALDVADLATPEQLAGMSAAFFLPILIAIGAVQGGMFIAIDVTAGEKERGTLESLLVTPSSDLEVFLGKLLAVFSITFVPITLTLLGFWGGTLLLPESMMEGAGALPIHVIVRAILVTLPLALFANVVLMVLSIRTTTFKDAQSALTPVIFVFLFAAMAAALVPPSNPLLFLVPVYGTAAVVGTLTIGGIMPANAVLFSLLGSLAATAAAVVLAMRLFNRERLLYS